MQGTYRIQGLERTYRFIRVSRFQMPTHSQMLFKKPKPIKIEIDPHAVHSQSPEVANKLSRIADNYRLIDEMWIRIESVLKKQADSVPVSVSDVGSGPTESDNAGTIETATVKRRSSRKSARKPKPR